MSFVHSERAINYDTQRISFVSGYQSLYSTSCPRSSGLQSQKCAVEKRSRNEHSHKWRSTRLHASWASGTMLRINKAVAFASARKQRSRAAPRRAAPCRSRVLTRVIASPQSKPGDQEFKRVTTVIEPAYTRHRGDRVQSVSWVRWTFADLSAVRPPPRRRCQRLSRGERGGPRSRAYTHVYSVYAREYARSASECSRKNRSLHVHPPARRGGESLLAPLVYNSHGVGVGYC